jgi:hypothetical protein
VVVAAPVVPVPMIMVIAAISVTMSVADNVRFRAVARVERRARRESLPAMCPCLQFASARERPSNRSMNSTWPGRIRGTT